MRESRRSSWVLALALGLLGSRASLAEVRSGDRLLFRALERRRDGSLDVRELETFLDPPAFRARVLFQVRRKMGFFGRLPGMQGFMETFGKEPPFARRNHAAWIEEHDADGDEHLGPEERRAAAASILAGADTDGDGRLDLTEFSALLQARRRVLAADEGASPRAAPAPRE